MTYSHCTCTAIDACILYYNSMTVTFIALLLVSMGSNNAASDSITVMMMNKMIVTVVLEVTNVYEKMKHYIHVHR